MKDCWWCGRDGPTRTWTIMGERELCDLCVSAVFAEMERRCAINGWTLTMSRYD